MVARVYGLGDLGGLGVLGVQLGRLGGHMASLRIFSGFGFHFDKIYIKLGGLIMLIIVMIFIY